MQKKPSGDQRKKWNGIKLQIGLKNVCTGTENNEEINNVFDDEDLMEMADFDDLNLNFDSVIATEDTESPEELPKMDKLVM